MYLPQYIFWMAKPTNKNIICFTTKAIIIPIEIGKLNIPNRGYTQRPFSKYVSKNLETKYNIIIMIIDFIPIHNIIAYDLFFILFYL